MNQIKKNLESVQNRINKAALGCGRNPGQIKLVAVSKTIDVERISQAISAGAIILGENYIQESREKISDLSGFSVSWHFIGHLQSNKAKYAVKLFDLIHSVDSIKLASAIDKEAKKIDKIQEILIQVNIGQEETKSGIYEDEALELVTEIAKLNNIKITGLMTIPPYYNEPDLVRPFFKNLADLQKTIIKKNIPNVSMNDLSMGMTGDFETAIEEGATMVRIGTAIFGKRIY